ncbi:hypothetical protein EIP86_005896 [Pleurotus ostreatoroseus]|nr:hypothetical protein EIP86_005896 [Pleurotus ostreatoroseus]
MNGASQTTTQLLATQERPMIPSDPQPSTSKRKAMTEDNPFTNAAKRLKKEDAQHKGQSQRPSSRQPSAPPSSRTTTNGNSVVPPAKKYRADTEPTDAHRGKGKEREILVDGRTEPEVEEDVRLMQSETDSLRRQTRVAESTNGINTSFQFPAASTNGRTNTKTSRALPSESRGRAVTRETSLPIPDQETPQIMRNKLMRGTPGHTRRKSSLTRGKRISSTYVNTGVITQPHTSVRDSSFYKHIDAEEPEPRRAQQLLIWCSHRAMTELGEESAKTSAPLGNGANNPGKDPPPISADDIQLLKSVEEDIIKMLAEGKVDTNVYSPPEDSETPTQLKENEQNVQNRAREVRFNVHIQKLKQEDEAWIEVGTSYNSFRSAVLAELEERKREFPSAKAKGKQKATAEDVALWDISEKDLPEYFRGQDGVMLARSLVAGDHAQTSPLRGRMSDLECTADRLYSMSQSALQATHLAEADLDRRFAALNLSMLSRTNSLPPSSSLLSAYLPPSRSRPPQTTDPQDLLRAMSRADAERPQTQVGDAARRAAREVQRAHDAPGGVAERRLTGVPPPTPRKPPGTPRRATTPGRGR